MNKFSYLALMVCCVVLPLSGCLQRTTPPAPVVQLGADVDSPAGGVIIHPGDTLYNISKRFNLPLQDIITLNRIAPPYVISDGQRLRLPAPRNYNVQHRDSLYRISRMFGVSAAELARMNNINAPYHLRTGQELRIPTKSSRRFYYVDDREVSVVHRQGAGKPSYKPDLEKQNASYQKPTVKPARKGEFIWPIRGRVVSGYGPKDKGLHNDGVNIAAPRGTAVAAAQTGTVVYVGNALEGFGNLVIIRHDNGWVTAYAHLDRVSVSRGQRISKGHALGAVGSTGRVDTPQLHFEIRRGSEAINPLNHLA